MPEQTKTGPKSDLVVIHPADTVAVAIKAHKKGDAITVSAAGKPVTLALKDDIPAGHKIALRHIAAGEKVIKYGCPIGAASAPIEAGSHVHTHNIKTLLSETASYAYDEKIAASCLENARKNAKKAPDIEAFVRKNGQIGIRNDIWIVPTVGCVNKTAEALAAWAQKQFCSGTSAAESVAETGNGGKIDSVQAWTHPYGCSQMGGDHEQTRAILADLVLHPNAAAVLVIGLGCENNTVDSFKKLLSEKSGGKLDESRVRFLVTQQESDEITAGRKLLEELATFAKTFKRQKVSAAKLVVGMKCGGSDGFSGITANALVGRVCDSVTQIGGTAILTEVPEMFGAEQLLMNRCENRETYEKTVLLINNFKQYFTSHNQVVYENPSPGNKEGGISTLEDKSLGCVQKSGAAPVCGVLDYGERVLGKSGLYLLEGPGNDIVSTTAMTAAGAHLILFTTGRGTPLGAPVPTIKIASNSDLARNKAGWIDFDAGRLFDENGEQVLDSLMRLIFEIASGKKQAKNETNGYREIAIFKGGVTL